MQAIKTVQLTKKYKDVTAVDGLDLTARQGELFALLGVNGAGKTTTIKMLTCCLLYTSGEFLVHHLQSLRRRAFRAGCAEQETGGEGRLPHRCQHLHIGWR